MDILAEGDLNRKLDAIDHESKYAAQIHKVKRARTGSKTYQTADNGPHVKYSPEPGKVPSLLILVGIRDHNRTLRGPEKTGTDTKPSTGKEVKACNASMN